MNDEQIAHDISYLKRLILAYNAFTQVIALSDHLRDSGITMTHPIYTPCLAGIATTYMKPFVQSKGLGVLPNDFKRFDDPMLKHTHDRLEESRNKLYAHTDLESADTLQHDDPDPAKPYEFVVELIKGEPPIFQPIIPVLNPEIGFYVRQLCVFQNERAGNKMNEILRRLNTGKTYTAGRYVLGKNFP